MYIMNGVNSPAAFTCHTGRGESTVDYMLCNKSMLQIEHISLQASNITDHDMLATILPMSHTTQAPQRAGQPHNEENAKDHTTAGPQAV
jgi:hypothetical protein